MGKCYAVVSGGYSDYRVLAVFSTEAKAKDFLANAGAEYDIEVMPFDDFTNPPHPVCWVVMNMETGDVMSLGYGVHTEIGSVFCLRSSFTTFRPWYRVIPRLVLEISVDTPDSTEAVKVASEKRAQLIAQGSKQPGVYDRKTLALKHHWS